MLRVVSERAGGALLIGLVVALAMLAASLRPGPNDGSAEVLRTSSLDAEVESPSSRSVSATPDPLSQRALDYTLQRVEILSGEPQVVLSMAMTQRQLIDAGLDILNYERDCARPFHLVILHGDFDQFGAAPGFASARVGYLAYLFDDGGVTTAVMADSDGSLFARVLEDPSLTDAAAPIGNSEAADGERLMPCYDVGDEREWPGAPAPEDPAGP